MKYFINIKYNYSSKWNSKTQLIFPQPYERRTRKLYLQIIIQQIVNKTQNWSTSVAAQSPLSNTYGTSRVQWPLLDVDDFYFQ